METKVRPATWKTLLAFAVVYFVWGSTFLAIRVGVREMPPLLMAGMRFLAAGAVLFGWMLGTGTPLPAPREWAAASFLAVLIFVVDYGLLFWAEQKVPSGIAAVMMATIPVFISLLEIIFLRTQRLTLRLAVALLVGVLGVAILMSHSLAFGEAPIAGTGAAALLIGSVSWSAAAILTRKLPLPASEAMSSAAQMVCGGALLMLAAAILGELHGFRAQAISRGAWFALVYLIVAGSIVGFTAYVWLIHHESPTKVSTYAYVNPVVAVLLGYFVGGEVIGPRTLLGTLLVLVSVILITTMPVKRQGSPVLAPKLEQVRE